MIRKLLDVLAGTGLELTPEELAEVLWLAERLPVPRRRKEAPAPAAASPVPTPPPTPPPTARPVLPEGAWTAAGTPATTTPVLGPPAETSLYPRQAATVGPEGSAPSSDFPTPAGHALPGALRLGRALRPLMRRTPSRTRFVLDEAATAQRIAGAGQMARSGAWLPVLNPAGERWLDLVLVVDESPSMAIWQRTTAELGGLLERQGAFRRVQLWSVRPDAERTEAELFAGTGTGARRARARELIDHQGRQLILVASDCVAPIWHNGAMATLLAGWGRRGPVAIVQMLPYPLWVRTGLRTFPPALTRAARAGIPNRELELRRTFAFSGPHAADDDGGVPIPVVTLQADPVGQWARALAGNSGLWLPSVLAVPLPAGGRPRPLSLRDDRLPGAASTTEALLRAFIATASSEARLLAAYLAAVPLTLPIIRLVQRVLLPGADQVHLAEVFLSGLVRRLSPGAVEGEEIEYDFVAGARPLLLDDVRVSQAVNVLRAVSEHVNRNTGAPFDFHALLADPTASGSLKLSERHRRFAEVAAPALRRFGGRFAQLAARLETTFGVAPAPVPSRHSSPTAATPDQRTSGPHVAVTIHALLVGIDDYDPVGKVPTLRGCVNDVRVTQNCLVQRFGVAAANVSVLVNEQATRANLARAWQGLMTRVKPGDQIFFLFSGHSARVRSDTPDDADGFAETLIAYDSRTEGGTDVPYSELLEWATRAEGRGARVILFLDTTGAGSGLFARRPPGNLIVLAACRENEQSHEYVDAAAGQPVGAATFFFMQALQQHHSDMTWSEVYDHLFANVKVRYPNQTPQLIGPGDVLVFANGQRPAAPHLVVLGLTGGEEAAPWTIRVHASAALGLQPGGKLRIVPPGAVPGKQGPLLATVREVAADQVVAEVSTSDLPQPGSRAETLWFESDVAGQPVRVAWDGAGPAQSKASYSDMFTFVPADDPTAELRYQEPQWQTFVLADAHGRAVIRPSGLPASGGVPMAALAPPYLKHLIQFRRLAALASRSTQGPLSGRVALRVSSQGTGTGIGLIEGQPVTLTAQNSAEEPLFVSVWEFTARLGVRRIFPPQSDCILVGPGRELAVPITLRRSDPARPAERVAFKVFATRHPANLEVLHLDELGPEVVVTGDFLSEQPEPARPPTPADTARPQDAPAPSPGGPAAVTAKLWPNGQRLRGRFLDGPARLRRKVAEMARLWCEYANIDFTFASKDATEIRVSFKGDAHWSCIGTDCLHIPPNEPTMRLGGLSLDWPEENFRRIVLREFGFALGLIAAHQSPVANIPWDRDRVYRSLTAPPYNWSADMVENYLFRRYTAAEVVAGPPDPSSIMHDPVNPDWLATPFPAIGTNTGLTAADKAFIARLYPRPDQPVGEPLWR